MPDALCVISLRVSDHKAVSLDWLDGGWIVPRDSKLFCTPLVFSMFSAKHHFAFQLSLHKCGMSHFATHNEGLNALGVSRKQQEKGTRTHTHTQTTPFCSLNISMKAWLFLCGIIPSPIFHWQAHVFPEQMLGVPRWGLMLFHWPKCNKM